MLNVQTEHLENHIARLTVEVEAERLDQAMRKAARKLSQKGRIPGFRPGKAPYNIVINLYGREYVLGEALDVLGQEIYREALDAAEIEPYAMGKMEDILEEGHKLVFLVPKRPTVELGSYREVRVEFETPEVTDEMVTETMENLRQNQALLELAERPAQIGDQVTFEHISVSVMLDEDDFEDELEDGEEAIEDETEAEETEEDQADEVEDELGAEEEIADGEEYEDEDEVDEETIAHEHDFDRVLRDDKDDFFPGFSAEIVGLSANDHKEFFLEVPEDADVDERVAGHTLHIDLHVGKVQARTVPDWSDELAKRVSEDKFETILDLRVDMRKQLEEVAQKTANQNVAMEALEKITEGAVIHFPEEVVQDYISDRLAELDQNVRQQGFTLKDYLRLTGQTEEQLREQQREGAIKQAQRSLVISEVVKSEQIRVGIPDIEAEIDRIVSQVGGEQSAQFRQFLTAPQSIMNIQNQLVTTRVLDRIAAIAKGENPPIEVEPVEAPVLELVTDENLLITQGETVPPAAEAVESTPEASPEVEAEAGPANEAEKTE